LFANNSLGVSLNVFTDSPTYDTKERKGIPYLDVSAAYRGDEVVINVVNRHLTEKIAAQIISQKGEFNGACSVYEVNGPDVKTENTFGSEPVKTVEKPKIEVNGNSFFYEFPPHSFVMIKGKVK
jgi:alpha-N-arabinofuranosidase